jgi:hypothetical protein
MTNTLQKRPRHSNRSFLLRFQEASVSTGLDKFVAGKTKTSVAGEKQPDKKMIILSGTLTKTFSVGEGNDADPRVTSFRFIPTCEELS